MSLERVMLDQQEIVEMLDPDWRDHFPGIPEAAEFYREYSREEWDAAVAEILSYGSMDCESAVRAVQGSDA